jgi:hypothetical protein
MEGAVRPRNFAASLDPSVAPERLPYAVDNAFNAGWAAWHAMRSGTSGKTGAARQRFVGSSVGSLLLA